MRAPTDLPRPRRSARGRVGLMLAAAAVFVVLVSLRGIAGFYTDFLWFDEVHFTSVWKGVLGAKVFLGIVFTLLFFVLMWVNLLIAERIAPAFRPVGPEEQFVERYHELVGARAGLVRIGLAALFALIAGPGAGAQWNSWLLFRNHVPFGARDAQFHRDVGFYVFQLPFMKYLVDWLFVSVVIVLIVTAVVHYLNGGIRFQTPMQKVTPQVKAHLSVLLAVLALLKAVGYYLQRYELVFSTRGVVQGASYTDVKAQLPALQLLFLISLFACGLLLYNILRRGWVLPVIAGVLWALVSIVAGAAYPAFIQHFRVEPTESVKERPYIDRNIRATRTALKLGATAVDFRYDDKLDAQGLSDNSETIRNVRLWDPGVLVTTYKRLQEIRNFYQFNDVDIDRYALDGRTTQILLSARELNPEGIPSASWVNRHLVYTHGYGVVMSPGNAVTADGNPDLLVKDLPPQGVFPITQPSIYFGQAIGDYAVVGTNQKEIDFTEANGTNHTSRYTGTGGVKMSSLLRRAALSLRFGDLNPMISGFITPSSRAIYVRDVDERVRKAAPFLRYDSDPYPVLDQGGRVQWIYDAYTITNRYPYAQRAANDRLRPGSGLGADFNYVRNSVKVVIDAYNGSMKFYVMDPSDPIVGAYRKAFPKLFTDGSRMPADLRSHLRYPEDLFRVQTNMVGLYHMTNPADFYNRTDRWDIAQEPGGVGGAAATGLPTLAPGVAGPSREARMDPYYLLMRLPGEREEDFLILQPFVPFSRDDSRKDLTAFMVAKSDPDEYGKLEVFVMPRERQIDGPALVNARINQQLDISKEITLLNQSGSKVVLGNLLVIPINQSLLYVQPLYVQAAGTPLPQFKRVIAVFADKVVMRDSLKDALTAVFGNAPPTLEQRPTGTPGGATGTTPTSTPGAPTPTTTPPPAGGNASDLLAEASRHFDAAQDALRRGDLAAYQRENDAARDAVQRAVGAGAGTPSPTSTVPGPPP